MGSSFEGIAALSKVVTVRNFRRATAMHDRLARPAASLVTRAFHADCGCLPSHGPSTPKVVTVRSFRRVLDGLPIKKSRTVRDLEQGHSPAPCGKRPKRFRIFRTATAMHNRLARTAASLVTRAFRAACSCLPSHDSSAPKVETVSAFSARCGVDLQVRNSERFVISPKPRRSRFVLGKVPDRRESAMHERRGGIAQGSRINALSRAG
jgi:hypothetical protein